MRTTRKDETKEPGLRGRDKQEAALRDVHGGTYDIAQPTLSPAKEASQQTQHQRAQPGTDVHQGVRDSDIIPDQEPDLPEGLARPRRGPYDRNFGRTEQASQVPGPKPPHTKKSD